MKEIQEIEMQVHKFNKTSPCIKLQLRISKKKKAVKDESVFDKLLEHEDIVKMRKAIARHLYEHGYPNIEIAQIIGVKPYKSHYYYKSFSLENEREKALYLQVKQLIK